MSLQYIDQSFDRHVLTASIRYETTSATLSFIYYLLCTYPETMAKAQQEVDEVVGDKVLTYEMLPKLKYLDACIKEAL